MINYAKLDGGSERIAQANRASRIDEGVGDDIKFQQRAFDERKLVQHGETLPWLAAANLYGSAMPTYKTIQSQY